MLKELEEMSIGQNYMIINVSHVALKKEYPSFLLKNLG